MHASSLAQIFAEVLGFVARYTNTGHSIAFTPGAYGKKQLLQTLDG